MVRDWHLSSKSLQVDVSVLGTGVLASRLQLKAPLGVIRIEPQCAYPQGESVLGKDAMNLLLKPDV